MSVTVFLADDHAVLREGLRLLLSSEPEIEVVGEAANGREAVERVPECYPDVVIMDIAMPEMNGIEAARQIADLCPDTRVLVLSMYSSSEHILRALEAGVRGYLLKESVGTEVVSAIHAVCAGRFYMGRKIAHLMSEQQVRAAHMASTAMQALSAVKAPVSAAASEPEPALYSMAAMLE